MIASCRSGAEANACNPKLAGRLYRMKIKRLGDIGMVYGYAERRSRGRLMAGTPQQGLLSRVFDNIAEQSKDIDSRASTLDGTP